MAVSKTGVAASKVQLDEFGQYLNWFMHYTFTIQPVCLCVQMFPWMHLYFLFSLELNV